MTNNRILTKILLGLIVIISIVGFILVISDLIAEGVILLAIATIIGVASKQIRIHDKDNPIAVLKMRLAKGEITNEEYEEIDQNFNI